MLLNTRLSRNSRVFTLTSTASDKASCYHVTAVPKGTRVRKHCLHIGQYFTIICLCLFVLCFILFSQSLMYLRLSSTLALYWGTVFNRWSSCLQLRGAEIIPAWLHTADVILGIKLSLCTLDKHSTNSYLPRPLCSRKVYELLLQLCNSTKSSQVELFSLLNL